MPPRYRFDPGRLAAARHAYRKQAMLGHRPHAPVTGDYGDPREWDPKHWIEVIEDSETNVGLCARLSFGNDEVADA